MPIHPILVHFPIAFYFLELVLLAAWRLKRDEAYRRFAAFAFRLGYLFMLAAMMAGYYDAGGIVPRVRLHFFSALAVFILSTGRIFYLRFSEPADRGYAPSLLTTAVILNLLAALTAYLGGELVYGDWE